jgi:hypothetical protein
MHNLKAHIGHVLGSVTSSAGAIAAWQTQLDWAMRVSASVVGIMVGLLTIRSLLRKKG